MAKNSVGPRSMEGSLQRCHLRAAGEECIASEPKKRITSSDSFVMPIELKTCILPPETAGAEDEKQAETCRMLLLKFTGAA